MKKTVIYWLRWILVLPGSILTGIAGTFVLAFVLHATFNKEWIEPYPELPERILTPFAYALGFVYWGAMIAPSYKTRAAIALASIYFVEVCAMAFLTYYHPVIYGKVYYIKHGGLDLTLGLIGALLGVYIFRHNLKETTPEASE